MAGRALLRAVSCLRGAPPRASPVFSAVWFPPFSHRSVRPFPSRRFPTAWRPVRSAPPSSSSFPYALPPFVAPFFPPLSCTLSLRRPLLTPLRPPFPALHAPSPFGVPFFLLFLRAPILCRPLFLLLSCTPPHRSSFFLSSRILSFRHPLLPPFRLLCPSLHRPLCPPSLSRVFAPFGVLFSHPSVPFLPRAPFSLRRPRFEVCGRIARFWDFLMRQIGSLRPK